MSFKRLKKALQLLLLSVVLTAISACSSTGTNANSANGDGTDTAAENSVETGGIGGDNNGNNDVLSNPNAMIPGANQKYFFDFDQSTVRSSDLPSIKVQSQYLVSHPSADISIEGNTDNRGSREYNIALGQRRADAVKKTFLLDGAGAPQMHTISYGAEKPVAVGNTETDYAQNRRVDIIYKGH